MKRFLILLTLCLGLTVTQAFAQEICNNNLDDDGNGLVDCLDGSCGGKVCEICNDGIDNDGDRFIDCYDKECNLNSACDGFFLGKDAICDAKPDSFPPFDMKLKFQSEPKRTNHVNRLIAGDVDKDGVPEIITTYRNAENTPDLTESSINILQAGAGTTLLLDKQINLLADGFRAAFEDIAMADINKDGCAEIFVLTSVTDGNTYRIIAYDCNGNKIWTNPIDCSGYPGVMGLADFDGDGLVELYTRTIIYDAHTGKLMGQSNIDDDETNAPHKGVNLGWGMTSNAPIAINILTATNNLELVAGCRIYSVAINRGTLTATLTLTKQRSEYATRTHRTSGSGTSIADFNQDGFLDVVAVGSYNTYNATTTIFFWDVEHNTLKTYTDQSGSGDYNNGWKNGAGRVNLADIDGDTLMNAVYVSGKYLYALKESATKLDTLWRRVVTEETSGYTGCTMFDFNADGKSEIVYRDEDYIYIYTTAIEGGKVKVTRSNGERCASRTSNEYPIVVDMDGDGSTEICVTCSTTNTTLGKSLGLWDEAVVRVYESANVPWVPARKLWNQHGYFVANVNDDLTIPKQVQQHHLIYADQAKCRLDGSSRPLNSFLNQSPYLNSYGCPSYAAPNLSFAPFDQDSFIEVDPPTCPNKNIVISFRFTNRGDIGLNGALPVSFYQGDPTKTGAIRLSTQTINLNNMNPGDTLAATNLTITGPGAAFDLYIVINDDGTTVPTPIKLPNTGIIECDYGDNVYRVRVEPDPADVVAEKIKDDIICPGATTHNGAAQAYVQAGAIKNTADYTFYWTNGPSAKPIPADNIGATITQKPAGQYSVYAIHKTVKCSTDTALVNIAEIKSEFSVKIDVISGVTNCKGNKNGHLRVVILDANNVPYDTNTVKQNFTFKWWEGFLTHTGPIVSYSYNVAGLPGNKSYTVEVTEKSSGCFRTASQTVPDNSVKPAIAVDSVNITCSTTSLGQVSASVNNQASGYTFHWSNGKAAKPSADYLGAVYANRPKGFYTVVAVDISTKCSSDTVTVEVGQTVKPKITGITKNSNQISCDPATNLGAATVNVTGNPNDYEYQWYEGQNTVVPATYATGHTTASVSGLKALIYTVKVTDKITRCDTTAEVTITGPTSVAMNLIATADQTTCVPNNSSITVQTMAAGSGATAEFDFFWYNGTSEKTVSDFPTNNTNVLSGVTPGNYTVKAVHKVTKCVAPAKTVTVNDNIPAITMSAPVLSEPNDCTTEEGIISVTVTAGSSSGYAFRWFKGGAVAGGTLLTMVPPDDFSTPTSSTNGKLASGTYTVEITSNQTGCKEEKPILLPFKNGHQLTLNAQTDITNCVPETGGSITVELLPTAGFDNTDYDVVVYEGSVDPITGTSTPVASNGAPNPNLFTANGPFDLNPEYYTVVAIARPSTGSLNGCRASVTTQIKKSTTNPQIDFTTTAAQITTNKFCKTDVVTNQGNGSITLAIGGNPADYDYHWSTPTAPNYATTKDLTGLKPGQYTVDVTYNTAINFGCTAQATFSVRDEAMQLTVNMANGDLATSAVTHCGPDGRTPLTEGAAIFNRIQVDGAPITNFTNYTFNWHKKDATPVADNDLTKGDIGNLQTGEYYVVATDGVSSCDVTASFVIEDKTINTVAVTLVDFVVPTQCLIPNNVGQLEVIASGNGATYSYNWFTGPLNPNGTPPATPLAAANTNNEIAFNLVPGTYSVEVTNNTSNCRIADDYKLELEIFPVEVLASGAPLTVCFDSNKDGALTASTLNALPGFYTFDWYRVTYQNNTRVETLVHADLKNVDNVDHGTYMVIATDKSDVACFSKADAVVEDLRMYPTVVAQGISPVTNCDPAIPNGMAEANVDGVVYNHTFDWYATAPPTGTTFYTGPQVSGLAAETYSVVASDIFTGCSDTTQVTIDMKPLEVPPVQIEILSHVTSCVENNGALAAAVNGNTMDYIFNWYNGGTEKTSADFTGEIYDSLAVGIYGVTATSRITGCTSPLVREELNFKPVYPEFTFEMTPANCEENNGSITVILTNAVEVGTITWTDANGNILNNANLLEGIPVGTYNVTITSMLGCPTSNSIEVKTDINIFNGISRNHDGANDFFHIKCIENFPGNVVKIFNRAGTLVYEATGYDNFSTYFDGKSNKGISMMGTNLPDGTYFYVVDKRDGSKPKAGYLEIVN